MLGELKNSLLCSLMKTIVYLLKQWTLPLAMLMGVLGYVLCSYLGEKIGISIALSYFSSWLTPLLIFTMLLLTFCKLSLQDLKVKKIHLYLLSFQLMTSLLCYFILLPYHKLVAEAVMICLLMPTATAAAVVTAKLGGSISFVTTYTLLINSMTAVIVPLFFPFVERHSHLSFMTAFATIISKVFPLLILPFIIALLLRRFFPKSYVYLQTRHGWGFYIWAVALAIVTGKTTAALVEQKENVTILLLLVMVGLFTCILQFGVGRKIGRKSKMPITVGQALGQKNTILAIWMAQTYLHPLAALGPGSYVIWQNLINAWQLWKKQRTSS